MHRRLRSPALGLLKVILPARLLPLLILDVLEQYKEVGVFGLLLKVYLRVGVYFCVLFLLGSMSCFSLCSGSLVVNGDNNVSLLAFSFISNMYFIQFINQSVH